MINVNRIWKRTENVCLMTLLLVGTAVFGKATADPHRFDDAIAAFEAIDRESRPAKGKVLFLGSSSIRRWDTASAFKGIDSLNRGFGGSQISDSIFFFDLSSIQ